MTRRRTWWFIMLVAAVTSGAWVIGTRSLVTPDGDAMQYDTLAWNLAQGRGFSLEAAPPYAPTMFREPLYPAWVAWLYRWVGHRPDVIPWFQIPLFLGTCGLTYALGRGVFHERIGGWAAVATAGFPTLANYPTYLLTETLAAFLLVASVTVICLAWRHRGLAWWAAGGGLLGCAMLCKAVVGPLACLMALGVIAVRRADVGWRRRLFQGMVMLACCGMVVGPWIMRNQRLFHHPQISLRGELVLWMRARKVDADAREVLQATVYNFSEYLGHRLFPAAGLDPQTVILEDSHRALARQELLMARGLNQIEANRRMGQEAIQRILQHPFKYLFYTPVEAMKLTAFSYVPALNEPKVCAWFARWPHGRAALFIARGMARLMAYPLLVLAAYGMWVQRTSWRQWWPLGILLVYWNGVHALLFGYGRHVVPLIPFYLLFAVVGVAAWRQPHMIGSAT